MSRNEQVFDRAKALSIRDHYRCAGCWGFLTIVPIKGKREDRVTCERCGDERGFVTQSFVERRQSDSWGEYLEAKRNLKGIIPVEEGEKRSPEEIMKELGF